MLTEKVSGFGYNGEYYDAATGMLNLRARQYEPAQARFSQRDSLKGWGTEPRSMNAYLYCLNDAINFFDASGAAMVAVNMTDGGGGRTSSTSASPSSLFQKAGQTVKTAVTKAANSAAEAAKAAQQSALTQAQISSILKESRNPANVLEKARANRAQAQATTPTVTGNSFLRSTKTFACMTQEEYDADLEVYGPQPSPITSQATPPSTPQPTPKPTPQPGSSPTTPVTRPEKASSNSSWKEIANTWFGAESRTTYQTDRTTLFDLLFGSTTVAEMLNFISPLTFEYGTGERIISSSSENSVKAITFFSEHRVDDIVQSSIGIDVNTVEVSAEYTIGLSHSSSSVIGHFNVTDISVGLVADLTKLHVGAEVVVSTDTVDGVQHYSYYNVSVNGMIAYLLFVAFQTGTVPEFENAYAH